MTTSVNDGTAPTAVATTPARSTSRGVRYACVGAFLLAVAFFAFVRVRLRNMPLERDEGEYAYMGQLMLQGIPPYQLASNMKLPGTYAAYAAIMAVFGETAGGIRIGLMLVTTAAAVLVFFLGKHLYELLTGSIAGITYLFLAARPGVKGGRVRLQGLDTLGDGGVDGVLVHGAGGRRCQQCRRQGQRAQSHATHHGTPFAKGEK